MITLLNPPRRKSRRKGKRGRRKKMTKAAIARRRSAGAKRAWARRRKSASASQSRMVAQKLVCGPMKRIKRLRKRCPVGSGPKRRSRRGGYKARHGGIAGIIASGRAPGARTRRSNPGRSARFNYRKRRRRRNVSWVPEYAGESENPSWVPSYAHNPGVTGALTAGFSPRAVLRTLPVIGGMFGNTIVTGWVSRMMPDFLASGPGNYVVGLGSAGLLGAAVGMLRPRWAAPVFMGGVIEVMTRILRQWVMPVVGSGVSGLGRYFNTWQQSSALGKFNLWQQAPGLGDFNLWTQDPALGCVGCVNGMHDHVAAQELDWQYGVTPYSRGVNSELRPINYPYLGQANPSSLMWNYGPLNPINYPQGPGINYPYAGYEQQGVEAGELAVAS